MKTRLFALLLSVLLLGGLVSGLALPAAANSDAPGTMKEAKAVSVNKMITDNIASNKDVDFFKFTLSSPGKITLNLKRPYQANSDTLWSAVLYGYDTNEICAFGFSGIETDTTSYMVGLDSGTYFLRLTGGSFYDGYSHNGKFSTDAYQLTIKYSWGKNAEKENNETLDTATAVPLDTKVFGSINDSHDIDYYKITLKSPGMINLTFSRPQLNDTNDLFVLTLYGYDTASICSWSFDGIDSTTQSYAVGLPAGTFYLRITGGSFYDGYSHNQHWTSETYTVTVNYTATNYAERENNNSFADATAIVCNQIYSGSINGSHDVDFYELSLKEPGKVTLLFTRPDQKRSDVLYVVTLFDSAQNKICFYSFTGLEVNTTAYLVGLGAGRYYVKITGGSFYDGYSHNGKFTTDTYRFRFLFSSDRYTERENNNTFQTATAIPVNRRCTASLNGSRDVDYYQITVPKSASYEINLKLPKIEATTEYWVLTVYNEQQQKLQSFSIKAGNTSYTSSVLSLQKGKYYLLITGGSFYDGYSHNNRFTTQTYSFALNNLNPFTDIKRSAYYYDAVLWAYNHDPQITGGTGSGKFSPGKDCTREQIVTFLWKAYGAPEPKSSSCPFTDVNPKKYYFKPICWALENKITGGASATTFGVGKPCTREQVVTFLWKAAGSPKPKTTSCAFTDVNPSKYYYQAILWAVENKITGGMNATTFGVGKTCTRAQVVTFLYAAITD